MSQEIDNLVIAIGASAGGLQPMIELLERLPQDLQATVIIATHRPPDAGENRLASILRRYTALHLSEPEDGQKLDCATLLVGAPSEFIVVRGRRVRISALHDRAMRLSRIDALFETVADAAGPNAIGVVLSGMLWDGVAGLQAIQAAGGRCLVQHPMSAEYTDMPRNALRAVEPDFVGDAVQLADELLRIARDRRCVPQ